MVNPIRRETNGSVITTGFCAECNGPTYRIGGGRTQNGEGE